MTIVNRTFIITTKEKQSKKIKGNNRTLVIRGGKILVINQRVRNYNSKPY